MRPNTLTAAELQRQVAAATTTSNQPVDLPRNNFDAGRAAYWVIALILGLASVALSAHYAAGRAADPVSSVIWASIGAALALALLLAPSEVVDRCRRRDWPAAGAALVLVMVSALFVLTGALGNASAGRTSTAAAMNDVHNARVRAKVVLDEATAELSRLAQTRLPGELDPLIAAQNTTIGANDCGGWVRNLTVRTACAERHALHAELARAEHRVALETRRDGARSTLDKPSAARPANADAAVLARFLGLLGVHVTADHLTDWLSLIAVFGVEFGGALAVMLARSATKVHEQPVLVGTMLAAVVHNPVRGAAPPAGNIPVRLRPITPKPLIHNDDPSRTAAIVDRLKRGAIEGSQRTIAERVGMPRTSMLRAIADDPRIKLTAGPVSSRLELVA